MCVHDVLVDVEVMILLCTIDSLRVDESHGGY